jgi:hypothetical protein
MANELTLADVYHPLQDMMQLQQAKQQLEDTRDRNRLRFMQMQELERQSKDKQALQNFISQPQQTNAFMQAIQPASPQGPGASAPPPSQSPGPPPNAMMGGQPQQPDPEQQRVMGKLQGIQSELTTAFDAKDASRISTVASTAKNDPEVKSYMEKAGIDSIDAGYDESKGAWLSVTKTYSDKDLENISQLPGGSTAKYLPAGKYQIQYDPIKKAVTGIKTAQKTGVLTKDELTNERALLNVAQHDPDPSRRKAAQDIYDQMNKEKVASEERKTGIFTKSRMYPVVDTDTGRTMYASGSDLQADKGKKYSPMSDPEFSALSGSLKNQVKVRGQIGAFVKNLDWQIKRLDQRLDGLKRTDARILNLPISKALMEIKGSANESILRMYLTDISNDIAKLSTGSSASIAELSMSAQERWNKIHDPNLPISELRKLLEETKAAGHGRMQTTDQQIEETKRELRDPKGKSKKPAIDKRAEDMTDAELLEALNAE